MRRWNVLGVSGLGFAMAALILGSACGSSSNNAGTGGSLGTGGTTEAGAPASGTGGTTAGQGGTVASDAGKGGSDAAAAGGSDAASAADAPVAETGTGSGGAGPSEAGATEAGTPGIDAATLAPGMSDGGTAGLLCSFDFAVEAGVPACATWTVSNNNADGTVTRVQDEAIPGNATPGAIQYVTKFGTEDAVRVRADFDPPRNWSALKALHAYVKVVTPGDAQSIQLLVRTGPSGSGPSVVSSYDISSFTVGQFKELTLNLTTVADNNQINRMGVQVTPKGADAGLPDAGPREATIVIDYVWVE